jgi:hypothetical protein
MESRTIARSIGKVILRNLPLNARLVPKSQNFPLLKLQVMMIALKTSLFEFSLMIDERELYQEQNGCNSILTMTS